MINFVQEIPWKVIEKQVRATTLLRQGNEPVTYPYADAAIELREIAYEDVRPTSLYVVERLLAFQVALAADLCGSGHTNPLQLQGGILLENGGKQTQLVPPVVERTETDGVYILDGAHRTFCGYLRYLNKEGPGSFNAIYIEGIDPSCPSYAYPNAWHEIRVVREVPTDPTKKKIYRADYRRYYRDFSTLNGSHLREG